AALGDRRRSPGAAAYLAAVTVLTATAAGLVALRPGLWPFLLLAGGTEAAIVGARYAPSHAGYVRLVCGSYVSLVTALLVVSWGSILAWVLPTVVGTVLVERAASSTRRPPPARRSSRTPTPSPLP
ncbi:MAG: hypothetical protein M3326_11810, partial [Actinomycetota bacterium]|nr:hypothetical protein [Actinomycetota bacterium]